MCGKNAALNFRCLGLEMVVAHPGGVIRGLDVMLRINLRLEVAAEVIPMPWGMRLPEQKKAQEKESKDRKPSSSLSTPVSI